MARDPHPRCCARRGRCTGLIPEGDETACADEADGKQCPPTCPTCTCAWHSLKTAPAPQIELKTFELTGRTVELPPPTEAHGLLVPPPTTLEAADER